MNHKTPWNFFLTEQWYAPSSGWISSLRNQFSTWPLEIFMMGKMTLSFFLWFQPNSQTTLHISALYQITLHDYKVSLWCTTNAVTITDLRPYVTFTSQFIAASEWHCVAFPSCVSACLNPIFWHITKLRKVTISFVMFACPSIHKEQLISHWMDSHEILYLSIILFFKNLPRKIHVPLISDKNNKYLTYRHMYINDI